jgi:hypothetical protein
MSTDGPEHIDTVQIYRDEDGYAVSWGLGGSWGHQSVGAALGNVAESYDSELPSRAQARDRIRVYRQLREIGTPRRSALWFVKRLRSVSR